MLLVSINFRSHVSSGWKVWDLQLKNWNGIVMSRQIIRLNYLISHFPVEQVETTESMGIHQSYVI